VPIGAPHPQAPRSPVPSLPDPPTNPRITPLECEVLPPLPQGAPRISLMAMAWLCSRVPAGTRGHRQAIAMGLIRGVPRRNRGSTSHFCGVLRDYTCASRLKPLQATTRPMRPTDSDGTCCMRAVADGRGGNGGGHSQLRNPRGVDTMGNLLPKSLRCHLGFPPGESLGDEGGVGRKLKARGMWGNESKLAHPDVLPVPSSAGSDFAGNPRGAPHPPSTALSCPWHP
jgi:hypothetical protein